MTRTDCSTSEYWCKAECSGATVIVDACDYYRAFYEQAATAVNHIYLSGWQFNSNVELLRGPEALGRPYPTLLLPFLEAICRERPDLRVYVLAWDYSLVFALEREWLQDLVFQVNSPSNLRFCFDGKHALGASQHQKLVTIDGRIAFTGGIDLASARWDDCRHQVVNPLRSENGEPQKPYHDAMVAVSGEAVTRLEQLFRERWTTVTGERLVAGQAEPAEAITLAGVSLEATEVMISRTEHAIEGGSSVTEILSLYQRAIAEARWLVYVETQYLTSRAIHDALVSRMCDSEDSRLQIVVVMPDGGDTPKESLALGSTQERILRSLGEHAEAHHCQFRAYTSLAAGSDESSTATFIHSKIFIVDDRLLAIGSANLTNRSMQLDTELCLAFESRVEGTPLALSIQRLRARLLAEHSGLDPDEQDFRKEGLVQRLDDLVASCSCRLRHRPIHEELLDPSHLVRLEQLFDPEKPLSELELGELFSRESVA
jgi:phosphatidylserine/phosphatidylglycerophosphate/cardiolipin synthase-like enzyme